MIVLQSRMITFFDEKQYILSETWKFKNMLFIQAADNLCAQQYMETWKLIG